MKKSRKLAMNLLKVYKSPKLRIKEDMVVHEIAKEKSDFAQKATKQMGKKSKTLKIWRLFEHENK